MPGLRVTARRCSISKAVSLMHELLQALQVCAAGHRHCRHSNVSSDSQEKCGEVSYFPKKGLPFTWKLRVCILYGRQLRRWDGCEAGLQHSKSAALLVPVSADTAVPAMLRCRLNSNKSIWCNFMTVLVSGPDSCCWILLHLSPLLRKL